MALAVNVLELHQNYSNGAIFDALRALHGLQGMTEEQIFVWRYGEYFFPTPEYREKGRKAFQQFEVTGIFPMEVVHDLLGAVQLRA